MSDRGVATRRLNVRGRVIKQSRAPRRENAKSGDAAAPAVANYIADMTTQLGSMASAAGLDLLAYFLAMAHAESEAASRRGALPKGEDVRSARSGRSSPIGAARSRRSKRDRAAVGCERRRLSARRGVVGVA